MAKKRKLPDGSVVLPKWLVAGTNLEEELDRFRRDYSDPDIQTVALSSWITGHAWPWIARCPDAGLLYGLLDSSGVDHEQALRLLNGSMLEAGFNAPTSPAGRMLSYVQSLSEDEVLRLARGSFFGMTCTGDAAPPQFTHTVDPDQALPLKVRPPYDRRDAIGTILRALDAVEMAYRERPGAKDVGIGCPDPTPLAWVAFRFPKQLWSRKQPLVSSVAVPTKNMPIERSLAIAATRSVVKDCYEWIFAEWLRLCEDVDARSLIGDVFANPIWSYLHPEQPDEKTEPWTIPFSMVSGANAYALHLASILPAEVGERERKKAKARAAVARSEPVVQETPNGCLVTWREERCHIVGQPAKVVLCLAQTPGVMKKWAEVRKGWIVLPGRPAPGGESLRRYADRARFALGKKGQEWRGLLDCSRYGATWCPPGGPT